MDIINEILLKAKKIIVDFKKQPKRSLSHDSLNKQKKLLNELKIAFDSNKDQISEIDLSQKGKRI